MIIAGIIGSLAGSGSVKNITQQSIYFTPIQEGQQQTIIVQTENWDNSLVYWRITDGSNTTLTSQVDSASGSFYGGNGTNQHTINFTFNADATTDGPLSYYVKFGTSQGANDILIIGPETCRDSSQLPALVLDVDPASLSSPLYGLNGWTDASGQGNNLSIGNGSKSADNGGTLVFNGTSTYAGDLSNSNLNSSVYSTISLSAWIKPTAATGSTQVIIAKELCYKLEITINGSIAWMTGKGYPNWEVTTYVDAGAVTAGAWSQVVATSDANYTRIYVNGVKIAETSGNIIGANTAQFDIGCYNSANDFFAGSMGEIKVWNYAITEAAVASQYNATAARYGLSPLPLSLSFPGTGNPYLLVSNTQSDWNLGSAYTIEFWSKSANASTGVGVGRTVVSQGYSSNNLDVGYINGHLFSKGGEVYWNEPTPGVWTHVAVVGGGADHAKIYYNGVYQTDWNTDVLSNSSSDLAVGRRGPNSSSQGFYGKLAMIHIYNAVKYTENFNPSVSYGSQDGTVLLLSSANPLSDLALYELNGVSTVACNLDAIYISKSAYPNLNTQVHVGDTVVNASILTFDAVVSGAVFAPNGDPDNWGVPISPGWPAVSTVNFSGVGRHPVSVQGAVSISTDFPHILEGVHNAFDGGTAGYAYVSNSNPNYALVSQIPVGATIFSNLWTGARTVISSQLQSGVSSWEIHYDATGLGLTSTSDTYKFIW